MRQEIDQVRWIYGENFFEVIKTIPRDEKMLIIGSKEHYESLAEVLARIFKTQVSWYIVSDSYQGVSLQIFEKLLEFLEQGEAFKYCLGIGSHQAVSLAQMTASLASSVEKLWLIPTDFFGVWQARAGIVSVVKSSGENFLKGNTDIKAEFIFFAPQTDRSSAADLLFLVAISFLNDREFLGDLARFYPNSTAFLKNSPGIYLPDILASLKQAETNLFLQSWRALSRFFAKTMSIESSLVQALLFIIFLSKKSTHFSISLVKLKNWLKYVGLSVELPEKFTPVDFYDFEEPIILIADFKQISGGHDELELQKYWQQFIKGEYDD